MKQSLLEKLRYQLILRPLGRGSIWSAERWESIYAAPGGMEWVDALEQLGHYSILAGYVRHLAASMPQPPSILDAGSGPGKLAPLFSSTPFSRYVAFDFSETAMVAGRALGVPRTEFCVASFDTFESEEKFDIVVFCESINHADRPEETLKRFFRFLAPGGSLLISMHERGASAARWRRMDQVAKTLDETRVTHGAGRSWTVRLMKPLS